MPFRNREHDAQPLAQRLANYRGQRPLVLGIPEAPCLWPRSSTSTTLRALEAAQHAPQQGVLGGSAR